MEVVDFYVEKDLFCNAVRIAVAVEKYLKEKGERAYNSSDCVTAVDCFARKVTMAGG